MDIKKLFFFKFLRSCSESHFSLKSTTAGTGQHILRHMTASQSAADLQWQREVDTLIIFAVSISTFFFLCSKDQYLMQNIYLMPKTQWTAQVMSCWDTTVFMINSSRHVIYLLRGMGVNFIIRETRKAEYLATGEALKAIFWPQKWTTDKSLDY